jgi:glutathione S-transferase
MLLRTIAQGAAVADHEDQPMKLYNSLGPNPRVVRMFLAEKGTQLSLAQVDVISGENRQEPYLQVNPHGQTPTLELDDGRHISEILPICEYLEEVRPEPPLVGRTPEERAETRMWARRVDLNICEPLTNSYRYSGGLRLFQSRMVTVPEAADGLRRVAQDRLRWLDAQMAGKTFLCGPRFTLADIHLFCFLTFSIERGTPLDASLIRLAEWLTRIADRPSAAA